MLVGVDDADVHGVPDVNAGHLQNSVLHSLHTCFTISHEMFICLKVASKSKLVQHLSMSLL